MLIKSLFEILAIFSTLIRIWVVAILVNIDKSIGQWLFDINSSPANLLGRRDGVRNRAVNFI